MKRILFLAAIVLCWTSNTWSQSKPKAPTKTDNSKQKAAPGGLTIQQVERLIAIHTPDQIVGGEVQTRGIAGEMNRVIIEKLKSEGAGPETLAALVRLIPTAVLTIHTTPGASVVLDGNRPILADESGNAIAPGLELGNHEVRAAKQHFRTQTSRVNLVAGNRNVLEVPLEWLIGFLNLRVSPVDATISISGLGQQRIPINQLPLSVGDYTITATAPYRESATRTVKIEGGKTSDIELALNKDAAAIEPLRHQIVLMSQQGNSGEVLRLAKIYQTVAGPDVQVSEAVALAYLKTKSYSNLIPAVMQAVDLGGRIAFPVYHDHNIVVQRRAHPASLVFSKSNLQYRTDEKCNTAEFTVPLLQIRMEVKSLSQSQGLGYLNLKLPNPTNPNKDLTMNFYAGDLPDVRVIADIAAGLKGR